MRGLRGKRARAKTGKMGKGKQVSGHEATARRESTGGERSIQETGWGSGGLRETKD